MRKLLGILAFALLLATLGFGVVRFRPLADVGPDATPAGSDSGSRDLAARSVAPPRLPAGADSAAPAAGDLALARAEQASFSKDAPARPGSASDKDSTLALADTPPPSGPALRRRIEDTLAELDATEEAGAPSVVPAVIDRLVDEGEVRIVFATPDIAATTDDLGFAATELAVRAFGGVPPDATRSPSGPALRVFPAFGHAAARVDAQGFLNLLESGATNRIEMDVVHRPSLTTSLAVIDADLAQADGADGEGYAVAVLDTGVDLDHPMFADRIVDEACFSLLSDCPNDSWQMLGAGAGASCPASECGHGTLVAGIAVGRQPDDSLIGVAPGAELISIQIFSDIGGGIGAYSSDILAGLQRVLVLATTHTIASVNLSLGGDLYTSTAACDAASGSQLAAVAALRSAGIAVVAASGNEGRIDAMASPGCLSNVIGVAGTRDDDSISAFSNVSDSLSVFAPGQSIETSNWVGGTSFASGTSMATPHVAGAIAAIREIHPGATVSEIENAFALTGAPVLDVRNGVTRPRIDVDDAIAFLTANATPTPPTVPAPVVDSGSGAGAAASPAGGGGGSACGLLGIEPFLVVGAVRLMRRRRRVSPSYR